MKFSNQLTRCTFDGPLGTMTLAAHDHGLVGIWFDGQQHQPDPTAWAVNSRHPMLASATRQLQEYFAGNRQVFDMALDLDGGTDFQQQVWRALLEIPSGQTVSYGTLSQRIGRPRAVRAVGTAIGRNPLSIVVPCHRIVGTNGALTGYAGGLDRKTALLQLESTRLDH